MLLTAAASSGNGRLVVIDAGHGGTNTGAASVAADVYEKQVTLDMATCVAERLVLDGFHVEMTRTDDRYLSLRHRVRRANELRADLFVSIHANATETHDQRGFETFILTPDALDIDGRALRAADGPPRPGVDPDTARLLDDVERGVVLPSSAELALSVQREMRAVRGADTDRGVRQDSMHVLLGATMPAVLVEIGFIDHPIEGRELLDPEVSDQICAALAAAISAY